MVSSMVAQADDVGRVAGPCDWQRMNGGRYPWVVMTKFSSRPGAESDGES